ncbi:hypothetical protein BST61_g5534 [Cercospora zeina]
MRVCRSKSDDLSPTRLSKHVCKHLITLWSHKTLRVVVLECLSVCIRQDLLFSQWLARSLVHIMGGLVVFQGCYDMAMGHESVWE